MTWTYGGDPAANDRDHVRFLIGDTDSTEELIQDEEIAHLLTESGSNPYLAGAQAAEIISLVFARTPDLDIGGEVGLRASQRARSYAELGRSLRRQAAGQILAKPYAGGIDPDEALPTAVEQTAIRRGIHDTPGTDPEGY